jgi:hypothetical protein
VGCSSRRLDGDPARAASTWVTETLAQKAMLTTLIASRALRAALEGDAWRPSRPVGQGQRSARERRELPLARGCRPDGIVLEWPVRGEDFVCPAAEQQIVWGRRQLLHRRARDVVRFICERDLPPVELEAAGAVFLRPAGACMTPSKLTNVLAMTFLTTFPFRCSRHCHLHDERGTGIPSPYPQAHRSIATSRAIGIASASLRPPVGGQEGPESSMNFATSRTPLSP